MAFFDWRNSQHWDPKPEPCGICHKPTNLRSERGKPAHKVCAEQWTDRQNQATRRGGRA